MNFSIQTKFLFSILILISLISCEKDEKQAEKSLEGDWSITEIRSYYGSFSENTFELDSEKTDIGQLGMFNFTEDSVSYQYTRNDTLYTGKYGWELSAEKVNAGFIRVVEFTLTIEDKFVFDVYFEDQTKNSEKNAKKVELHEIAVGDKNLLIDLVLEKQ